MRKMVLDGYAVKLNLPELHRMTCLLHMCSNNLNQYAKWANASGQVYNSEIAELRTQLDGLIGLAKQILEQLTVL